MALGPSYADCFFQNTGDFTALASFTSEASLLAGQKHQPVLRAGLLANRDGPPRVLTFYAMGVLSCTGTPTYTFTCRLGSTAGDSSLAGTAVGVSAAITCASGVTNKWWELMLRLVCRTPGIGSGNCTVAGAGYVASPGGFASPFRYALEPTTPDTATWTATLAGEVANYFNLSVACSASSASNTIQCKHLEAWSGN